MRIDLVKNPATEGLVLGRLLEAEDVATAHRLIDQHQPCNADGSGRMVCASATHMMIAATWPCARYRWAEQVILAEDRGEIADSNVRQISA